MRISRPMSASGWIMTSVTRCPDGCAGCCACAAAGASGLRSPTYMAKVSAAVAPSAAAMACDSSILLLGKACSSRVRRDLLAHMILCVQLVCHSYAEFGGVASEFELADG